MTIGDRLKEERERMGKTIPALATIAGVSKNTVIGWQNGTSAPPATELACLAAAGMDVLYVITGQRVGGVAPTPALTHREAALLDNYRHSPEDAKAALDKTSAAFAQPKPVTKRPPKAG